MTALRAARVERSLVPPPSYRHLAALTDQLGLFEHAKFGRPRLEHGYCVDDVARGLLVTAREPFQDASTPRLTETYLRFIEAAIAPDGTVHNRRDVEGEWTDEPALGDWWGRALWGLGVAAVRAPLALTRKRALRAFLALSINRSEHPRAMVFAALGAGELALAGNADERAVSLLRDALARIPERSPAWDWPEPELRYANGAVAEALILGGAALGDPMLLDRGLRALHALVRIESQPGHFSVTGTAGRRPTDEGPQFDQQPIELAAIADAAARALAVTRDDRWAETIEVAWAWFVGSNDGGEMMIDLETGAGYDGLHEHGRNENRGAESTLAALSTQQQARRIDLAAHR
jgi:hypothetical protein